MRKFRLNFFKPTEKFNGNRSILESKSRERGKVYRERWSHDKEVRATHDVNCTGSCSWKVFIENGVVTWEDQQTDYPGCGPNMPEYEPRGCPWGAPFSWYECSPFRVKYPYIRGKLWNLWTEALEEDNGNRVAAWASIAENESKAKQYKQAQGMGGHMCSNWRDVAEIIAAQLLYVIKEYDPDRIAGLTSTPAMSVISYAAGARFINLLGGEMLSFYDWYADLSPTPLQIWGEQIDVPELSDWYNAPYVIMWGSSAPLARAPDAHFMTEVRYKGTKVASVAPDYAENVRFVDNWLASNPGSDAVIAQVTVHVILQEHYVNQPNERFINYAKQYTDMPFLIILNEDESGYRAGWFLGASDLGQTIEQGEWKPIIHNTINDSLVVPNGVMDQRWEEGKRWGLKLGTEDGSKINPTLPMTEGGYELEIIRLPYLDNNGDGVFSRPVPTRQVASASGDKVRIVTIFDLMTSQCGVRRFDHKLGSKGYDDMESKYIPAWQEAISDVKRSVVIQVAKEFVQNTIDTEGRSMIIIGTGINHWLNSDTIYRSISDLVMLRGCQGVNGGDWARYAGREKYRPVEGRDIVALMKDWQEPSCLQNGASWFYFVTDRWKYGESSVGRLKSPLAKTKELKYQHPADYNVLAARLGRLPPYPQLNKNSLLFVEEVKDEGIDSSEAILQCVIDEVKSKQTWFAIEDPDLKKNHPKSLFVWRSNLTSSSTKGQGYSVKHLFSVKSGLLAAPNKDGKSEEITRRKETTGKLDLVVSLDFRMTAIPSYSDAVLSAATWYREHDLSPTDIYPYIYPSNPAIDPLRESCSGWDICKTLVKAFSEVARNYLPGTSKDVVTAPLSHDTKQEISAPYGVVKDWSEGGIEAVPGRTMSNFAIVERDYTKIHDKYATPGPILEKGEVGAHGVSFSVSEQYEELKSMLGTWSDTNDDSVRVNRPRVDIACNVADVILSTSSAANGKLSQKSYGDFGKQTGVPLEDIPSEHAAEKISFSDIVSQPQKVIPTTVFPGSDKQGRRYSPFTMNIEHPVPFRALTGRQNYYVDHEVFQQFGESLPVYKPTLPPMVFGNRGKKIKGGTDALVLRYLTPHRKWNIYSMYQSNKHMLTLFRGGSTVRISNEDAERHDIQDNDWLGMYNRNGVVVVGAVILHRMSKGTMPIYHA